MDEHYLGIDIGTSGCRACVIDRAACIQAEASAPLPAPAQRAGGTEQDAEIWWETLGAVLDRLAAGISLSAVAAIAVDGTSATLLCCDAAGRPLAPALMYQDARAVDAAREIAALAPPESAAHGANSSLAKLRYLHAAGLTRGARHVLHQADWLAGRLARRYGVCDENNALKLGYDPVRRVWPAWLEDLDIPTGLLPEVVPSGRAIGTLDPAWCSRWGFSAGTRLISGTTDSTAGFIATGAGPGEAVTSLGSTLVLKVCTDRPLFAPRYGIYSHRLGDHWLAGGASNSGGAVLRHYFTAAQIDRLSAFVQPGKPTGLDYYPLSAPGERFPEYNPALPPRLVPRPTDDAVFFQGMLEGMAAIEQRGYRLLAALGAPWPRRVHSVGGGAANTAWRAIREALLGVPIIVAEHQSAAYGAALLARRGADDSRSLSESC
jgi:sugar (pentulose or hexulose) kinase